ncbi:MAG TPA: sigma 54-interacting transcriptional regulator, partial [Thermoanaerobaculia bacterium]|nr:sigma 54-interacting transcriptional regulator [Thermoanaerobaculia bacterium]
MRRTSPRSTPRGPRGRGMPGSRRRRELTRAVRTRCPAMRALLDTVEKALDHDVNILILGESGSGKGWLAETIHRYGSRRDEPF